ncbi:hypothetical protein C8J57DRAFT_1495439 [Mycena rebaudengoi]|nr:hypothetical protein C8J57DRAFT_1495439 [Mycena rebaudengoi]
MQILSILALCLISGSQASANHDLYARDPSQTVPLTEPSPTSTDPKVLDVYATYSKKCGTDLTAAAQSAVKAYEDTTGLKNVSLDDQQFISWATLGFAPYTTARTECGTADSNYLDALAASKPSSPSSSATSPPQSSSKDSPSPSSSTTSSGTVSGSPTASAPPPPESSKPGAATFHGPSWALAVSGLVAAAFYA